jgi:hypothetical protein
MHKRFDFFSLLVIFDFLSLSKYDLESLLLFVFYFLYKSNKHNDPKNKCEGIFRKFFWKAMVFHQ